MSELAITRKGGSGGGETVYTKDDCVLTTNAYGTPLLIFPAGVTWGAIKLFYIAMASGTNSSSKSWIAQKLENGGYGHSVPGTVTMPTSAFVTPSDDVDRIILPYNDSNKPAYFGNLVIIV